MGVVMSYLNQNKADNYKADNIWNITMLATAEPAFVTKIQDY